LRMQKFHLDRYSMKGMDSEPIRSLVFILVDGSLQHHDSLHAGCAQKKVDDG